MALHQITEKPNFFPSHGANKLHLSLSLSMVITLPLAVQSLGTMISSNLTWSKHIEAICKKEKKQLGLLHRKLHESPSTIRHKIYCPAILPKLDYCSAVWAPHHSTDIYICYAQSSDSDHPRISLREPRIQALGRNPRIAQAKLEWYNALRKPNPDVQESAHKPWTYSVVRRTRQCTTCAAAGV